jgi:hypothetical protein
MSFRRLATAQLPTTWAAAVAKSESWPIVVSEYVYSLAASSSFILQMLDV